MIQFVSGYVPDVKSVEVATSAAPSNVARTQISLSTSPISLECIERRQEELKTAEYRGESNKTVHAVL